jgi:hypothetical protein
MPLRPTAAALADVLTFNLLLQGAQPHAVGLIPAPWDKLAHVVFFGAIAIAVGIGLADAIAKASLPGRSASLLDFSADVLGADLAVTLRIAAVSVRRARNVPSGVQPGEPDAGPRLRSVRSLSPTRPTRGRNYRGRP